MREVAAMAAAVVAVALLFSIVVNGPAFANADTDPNDASVLRAMFSSLNSPSQLTKWSSSGGDPCGESWKGVTCSGNRVTEIKLSSLGLSGSMGFQLDQLKSVTTFDISNNNLGNQLPYQLPQNVQRLNLAGNGFSGGLPYSISQMTSLKYLNVSHNQFQGQVNDMFGSLSSLSILDFSFNSLAGNLPQSFSSLSSMSKMFLQNNQFTGTINALANLPLDNLNVENNRFTGWIPQQLKGINSIQTNGNSWSSGPAPPPPPGTPPASKPNRNHKSGGSNSHSNGGGSDDGSGKSGIGGGAVAGIVISILIIGAIVAFFVVKRKPRRTISDIEKSNNHPFAPLAMQEVQEIKSIQTSPRTPTIAMKTLDTPIAVNLRPPPVDYHKTINEDDESGKPIVPAKKVNIAQIKATRYSIADLQMATDSFSVENRLGEGSFGRVYRAQFEDGKVLAVKKISSSALRNPEDFLDIVSEISRLQHPNVVELVGYCSEYRQHLLVYEFHKNGSLHDLLHLSDEYNNPLTWNSRVKIALGTARALEYLHEVCSPSVVHKTLKSANILLDSELNPHLSHAGLASLIPAGDQALNHNSGSGYGAPEVAMSGQHTIKSDVYSFGVAMLELLTGRKPFDSSRPRSEQSLVRWATPQLHDIDALSKMVDPALKGLYPVKSLSRFADVIALCVQLEPEFRPPMSEVVEALVRLVQRANMSKRTFGNDQGDNADAKDYGP
ncbi:protein STRUBBELIG-RECEPTOR FAMILY 7-like [Ipomoea triloba]|uniref:protein STRUBBELIG-RECEPTOR FAMILY 7-like n=1 Tax=Ipomoea triloba TaxID=35885 RepID=UPI00125D0587|nr:protein STRUBBELIG-RECEPTOR FAMILY 7-like [Ipomoea triloba]